MIRSDGPVDDAEKNCAIPPCLPVLRNGSQRLRKSLEKKTPTNG